VPLASFSVLASLTAYPTADPIWIRATSYSLACEKECKQHTHTADKKMKKTAIIENLQFDRIQ
jgi:hypothetical protein